MTTIRFDPSLTDDERRDLIFAGEFCVYSTTPMLKALCNHASELIHAAFKDSAPESAQYDMDVDAFVSTIGPLKALFTNDQKTKVLIRSVLQEFGHDLKNTYFDVPRLRIVSSDRYLTAGLGYAYKAHRDTWYSSSDAQINWWLPVFDLESERSLALYPGYWGRPIKNTSFDFDYDEWTQVGRAQATAQTKIDTRKHPLPVESVDSISETRLVLTSGQPVLFSGAHLHATVPNASGKTRFSIDFRTVHLADVRDAKGAPNIDSLSQGTTLADFILAADFSSMDPMLVAQARAKRAISVR